MTKLASDDYKPNLLTELILRLKAHPAIALLLIVFLVASGIIALKVYNHLITDNHQKAFLQRTESIAGIQAARVNSYIKHQQQKLSSIVESRQVIDAFIQDDTAALAELESQLVKPRSESQSLHLLKPGSNRLDGTDNFAARELVSRAFKGDTPNPEAVRLQKGWRLLFVLPVKDNSGSIVGVALRDIATTELIKNLQPESAHGQTLLYQQLPGLQGNAVLSTGL